MMASSETRNEVGFVTRAKHYLLSIEGLPSARVNDIVVDQDGNKAIVRALEDDHVVALTLGKKLARPGDRYTYSESGQLFSVGEHMFGRIINSLGEPVDGGPSFPPGNVPLALDVDAPGIEVRIHTHAQLYTGMTLIDTLVPVAKGQRQLLFGDMNSGMTTFLTETVLNQRSQGTVCIYVAIGKPLNSLREITDTVFDSGNPGKTIVISALSDDPTPVIILAPAVAYLIAEYFCKQGEDVLIILDDLGAHAKYLREIALLEGRLPSTESYPGDIFYQHASLMERSGHFGEALGGGSVTTLPVIKSDLKSLSDLIPTNLMGCTDGHLAFQSALYAEGTYPAISFEESVTRVGRKAQKLPQKQLTSRIQVLLSRYRQQLEYSQFSAQVSEDAQKLLNQGAILEALLRQNAFEGIPPQAQVPLLCLAFTPFLMERDIHFVRKNKKAIIRVLLEDERLEELRQKALEDVALDDYLPIVEKARDIFEEACQQ